MSDSEDVGWVPVEYNPRRLVSPGVISRLSRGENGVVASSGHVMISGAKLDPLDDGLEPGMDVRVRMRGGSNIYARPLSELTKDRSASERRELKERAHERAKDWKQNRAREFWDRYDIPFQWDVAIKGRLSGLSRGSWGDGRAANTVEHLFVLESFEDGRLKRGADTYLCDDSATHRFTEGERRTNSEGETYIPPVTCSACLDFMDRWKVEIEGES